MGISLYDYQLKAIDELRTGSVLCGGVGSGKSRTALGYYFLKVVKGKIKINGEGEYSPPSKKIKLYIITTARKRDTLEWDKESGYFVLKPIVDSWNNIKKYVDVKDAFFIFDEQRVVGSGAWVKSFLKITKKNDWILLSATPGDTWMDYVPIFIANGFYRNRTDFISQHVVYSRFSKYPKVERYLQIKKLEKLRSKILVTMDYTKPTISHHVTKIVPYDDISMRRVINDRWDIFEKKPIRDASRMCYLARRIDSAEPKRLAAALEILKLSKKAIIFYNFDFELDMLRDLCESEGITYSEWNGHKHDAIPNTEQWAYLVQYMAGAEGWNCIDTDTIIFYSQNYSYKLMTQAAGRIDRVNTPYLDLWYYHLKSNSKIDNAIANCLKSKKNFNERAFCAGQTP